MVNFNSICYLIAVQFDNFGHSLDRSDWRRTTLCVQVQGIATTIMKEHKLKQIVCQLRDVAETGLKEAINKYNATSEDAPVNHVLNDIQSNLKCCGSTNASDWEHSFPNHALPWSCCPSESKDCAIDNKSHYTKGIFSLELKLSMLTL